MSDRQQVSILLFADYGADPLWLRDKPSVMVALDDLPLSAGLKGRLRAWAARFDALSETGYEWPSTAAQCEWVADGQKLLDPLRRELGSDYDVSYFDYGCT